MIKYIHTADFMSLFVKEVFTMKKWLFILALALLMQLSACNSSAKDSTDTSENSSIETESKNSQTTNDNFEQIESSSTSDDDTETTENNDETSTTPETTTTVHIHSYSDWTVSAVSTCIKEGQQYRVCTECGAKETTALSLSGHNYGNWVVTASQTCTTNGTKVRTCSVCGKTESQTIPANGHQWNNWVVTKEATYESAGSQSRKCSGCGKTENQTIPVRVLTDEDKTAMALVVAKEIAASIPSGEGISDIDRVSEAAWIVSQYCSNCTYTMEGKDYRTAYGVFVKGEYSCAGATRALGMVLECMGYEWYHVNEGEYTHQWCRLKMDGKMGYADGQVGWAGYGNHPVEEY